MQLDILDKKILFELDLDARASCARIGKAVRADRAVVAYRIKKLEETGVIKGYFTEMNNAALGLVGYRVFYKLRSYDPEQERAFVKDVLREKRVAWAFKTSGRWDFDIVYWFTDRFECYDVVRTLKNRWNGLLAEMTISTVVLIDHFSKDYLVDATRKPLPSRKFGKTQYVPTTTDILVLRALSTNARSDILRLSKETGLAVNTIKKHMALLKENGVILGFRPSIDIGKIGYDYVRVHLHLTNYTEKEFLSLKHALELDTAVQYLDYYINAADIEIEYQVPIGTLTKKLDELRARFGKYIASYDIIRFEHEYVARYMPEL